jgi:hypothetical protein
MGQSAAGLARDIARSLVDVLTTYEEELTALERETPAVAPLREALGVAIADACHVICQTATGRAGPAARAH